MVVNGAKIYKLANQKEQMELLVQLLSVIVTDIAIFKEMEVVLLVPNYLVADGVNHNRNV
jgi:hypothetical protein